MAMRLPEVHIKIFYCVTSFDFGQYAIIEMNLRNIQLTQNRRLKVLINTL